jgi:hypothetical protein
MSTAPFKIVLLPLDERPVNTRYPEMLAAIGGAELRLPPVKIRGLQRTPARFDHLIPWLQEAALDANACIVSCDFLGYGNLINARISDDNAATVLGRLAVLADICTCIPVHAFSLVTRVSNADDNVEEPLYWEQWGSRFYRYSRLRHKSETGTLTTAESDDLAELRGVLPPDMMRDWMTRRLRNHSVNLALLEMAARHQVSSLLLTSDDTAAYGFPTRERDWLRSWSDLVGPALADRVRMYPGADEVGSALVARLINEAAGRIPRVWIEYAIPGDEEIVAPYEDRPVRETVTGQIAGCGCTVAMSIEEADWILGVVTPSPRRTDYRPEFLMPDRSERTDAYKAFLNRLADLRDSQAEAPAPYPDSRAETPALHPEAEAGTPAPRSDVWAGLPIAIADVAYPNGSDPLFSELLLADDCPIEPGRLAAYGAWNTAGNTLGVVVAQAALSTGNPKAVDEQKRFLAHRFLEDYGYQLIVRREARAFAEATWGRHEPDSGSADEQKETRDFVEHRLRQVLTELQARGIGTGLHIVKGSVLFPWWRTFEIDFELAE